MVRNLKPEETTIEQKAIHARPLQDPPLSHVAFLNKLFAELEAQDICYCILRNFEGLPNTVNGDIDILVRPEDLEKAEMTLKALLGDLLLIRRIQKNGHLLFYVTPQVEMELAVWENRPAEVVKLDFVTKLQWKGITYLDARQILATRQWHENFHVAGPKYRACHLLCHAILDKKFIKSAYKKVIEESISQYEERAFDFLIPFIGSSAVQRLYSAMLKGDDAEILGLRNYLIMRLLLSRPQSVPSYIAFLARKYMRIMRTILFPPGILIAAAGPDGAGKTTLLGQIETALSDSFDLTLKQYMGWKEFILPTKRLLRFIQNSVAHHKTAKAWLGRSVPGMRPPWTHNFSVLHYFLDLWARYLFRIRPVLVRSGLVLCDRYFFDFLVQDVWICKNFCSRSLLLALTPGPTLTILFNGDPEAIAARKQEISAEETARQLADFSVIKEKIDLTLELDAMRPLDKNVMEVLTTIFMLPGKEDAT